MRGHASDWNAILLGPGPRFQLSGAKQSLSLTNSYNGVPRQTDESENNAMLDFMVRQRRQLVVVHLFLSFSIAFLLAMSRPASSDCDPCLAKNFELFGHPMAFKPLAVFCLALLIWTWNTWNHGASQSFVNPRPKLPVGPVPPVRHVGPASAVFRNSMWSARSVGFGTVRFANSAVLLVVAVFLVALKKPAVSAWVGFVMHALTTGIMRGFPCPIKIPVSFRREARSNLAKSYIAQAILLSLVLTSQSPTSAMVSKYLLFALIFVTSIFFDWPDPPLLDQAPALVFPGAPG